MIRKLFFYCAAGLMLISCTSDLVPDCYREPGTTISRIDELSFFNQINVGEGVNLVLKQGSVQEVKVETGENIIGEVTTEVTDGVLLLKNNMKCSLGTTTPARITVTAPDITKIYSESQYDVVSDGILNFPGLTLQQGLFGKTASGLFVLDVNSQNLVIENNNASVFRIKGMTTNLYVSFYSGEARFEGQELEVENAKIFQRSSNDIILKPNNKIEGDIYSNGNVILLNYPAVVNVIQHYTGHLIYQ
ncbi:DUF2807 domain-containing protein [Flavobacterium sp. SM15]|uniref:head GIN domain-containing protein n=1 Tax=Flavobacterium sp. SM15 TaxID=2908005 RepID=UPI001EDBE198|nr:head GIN domain-containing protein [Flavobacterium sp. SM15]MCG2609916.1 DUF2807 domain-containing protein [Flavobacterium sp. SM15]